MSKQLAISGFPEWLPEQRIIENTILNQIRNKFELFGFLPMETRAVEPLSQLLKQGETDKEIYVLRRLQTDDEEDEAEFGLHFDLTVPLARYVQQYRGQLNFPLKRYQIQKVWRGERPQEGRYREFYQADIDVIGADTLPLHFDAEMPWLLYEVLKDLPIPQVHILINNRKLLEGYYRGLGIEDIVGVLRIVDKLDKIGEEGTLSLLVEQAGLSPDTAKQCLAIGHIQSDDTSFVDQVKSLGVRHELLDEGLDELAFVMTSLEDLPKGAVKVDLHIARGLDYYTGMVYEGFLQGHESLGAVCSGGRYDDLASSSGKNKMPGVGVSIGITRILGYLFSKGLLQASRKTPTCVLVALPSEEKRSLTRDSARQLRERGICCETYHLPQKYGKQIRYAERLGIPYVWFPETEEGNQQVRDIRLGEQSTADPASWMPPKEDLNVQIEYNDEVE